MLVTTMTKELIDINLAGPKPILILTGFELFVGVNLDYMNAIP